MCKLGMKLSEENNNNCLPESTTPGFTNYAGQVPGDQPNQVQNMTYPDSGPATYRPPSSHSPSPMSIIPSNQSFPGTCNFQYEFGKQPKDTKSTAWTYSMVTHKLYAQKDAMCPIRFRIDCDGVAKGLFVRALPVYSRPEYLQDVVKRCPNHVQAPESANIPHREHFIWCENQGATYVSDPHSGRYAVVVPYDTPPAGTPWVTYLFSFKCLNSCVGGPNRREMSIIYTLENSNQEVLGRVCLDLRICACPGRDRKSDEGKIETQRKNQSTSTAPSPSTNTQHVGTVANIGMNISQTSQPAQTYSHIVHEREMIGVSKRSRVESSVETFNLSIRGKRNYEILALIRDSLEMSDSLLPHAERDRYKQQRQTNDRHLQPYAAPTIPPMVQRLPHMTSAFNFSSAIPFNIKQDVVDSTQKGVDVTDGGARPAAANSGGFDMPDCALATATSSTATVADWLGTLGLGAYIDDFHTAGLYSMDQLRSEQNFTIKDLESMKLTKPTVTKIWNSLKGYRLDMNPYMNRESSSLKSETVTLPDSQGSSCDPTPPSSQESLGASQSQRSAVSLGSGVFPPGMLELTRCSVKFTVTKKKKRSPDEVEAGSSTEEYRSKKHKALKKESKPE